MNIIFFFVQIELSTGCDFIHQVTHKGGMILTDGGIWFLARSFGHFNGLIAEQTGVSVKSLYYLSATRYYSLS